MDGLKKLLRGHGYAQTMADSNVYTCFNRTTYLVMAITIDDLLVGTNSPQAYQMLLTTLRCKYTVKDLGTPKRILGWNILRHSTTGASHTRANPS